MTFTATNLTDAEYFKLNGALSADRIESLLFISEGLGGKLSGIQTKITEAHGCFPNEDEYDKIVDRLRRLQDNLRGNNKEILDKIISAFVEITASANQSSEYGIAELNDAEDILASFNH